MRKCSRYRRSTTKMNHKKKGEVEYFEEEVISNRTILEIFTGPSSSFFNGTFRENKPDMVY